MLETPKSKLQHYGYLHRGKDDPRPEILRLLKKYLGSKGSIVAYNAGFEIDKIAKCCEVFPGYKAWFPQIQERIVDLLDPFKAFYYYHYKQEGSASIKSVLPAITGKGYEGLTIADGGTASSEYLRITFGDVREEERNKVRNSLEEYCGLDTEAMALIIAALRKFVE